MKALLCLFSFVALAIAPLHAADHASLEKLRAADDERVAAVIAADPARLGAIFSDELRYAHNTGAVDTKASYTEALTTGKTKYLTWQYEARDFTFPAPSIALMTGRAKLSVASPAGPKEMSLAFLGVYREEHGQWRFLSWQSCRLAEAGAPAAPAPVAK